jgi:hypothetical protein
MENQYKTIVGSEALEREFEQLIQQARPVGGARLGLFSAQPKPAQLKPQFFDYTNGAVHALISARADHGEPLVRYFDLGENPRVSPQHVQVAAQKLIEACRKTGHWRDYFGDNKSAVTAELVRWSAAPVDERPLNPPGSESKSQAERFAEGKRFIEASLMTPEHLATPGKP